MKPQPRKFAPQKILILLHGSIGDVTRALPLANCLRQAFPQAFLAWSVEPAAYPLLQGNPALDEIIVFDRRRWWKSFGPFLANLRAKQFDLVLDLQRHLKSGIISWSTGAAQRIGFHREDSKEGNWLFNNLHIERFGDGIAKLEHYLKFADYLGIARAPIAWTFNLSSDELAAVERQLVGVRAPFAVLFVGSRWPSKRWFPKQIAECAKMMQSHHGLEVVLLGGPEDSQDALQAMVSGEARMFNLVGRTSLREAIGLIQRAQVAVGPDTGLMHIAAAVGTPVISLWGATDPRRTGPFGNDELVIRGRAPCAPCHQRSCPIGRICMQSIASDEIAANLRLALQRHPVPRTSYGSAS
jgi:heptosyltransferase-1